MKVLDRAVVEKRDKLEAVLREKEILEEFLDTPQIIDLEGTMIDEENLYFITEYCENGTLETLMKNFPELPLQFSRYVLREILLALADMHKAETAHRDLKPGNILLTKDWQVKLCDLGEAKQIANIDRKAVKADFEKALIDEVGDYQEIKQSESELFGSL